MQFALIKKKICKNWDLYLIFLPVFAYYVIFKYIPMYGVQIAFKNFSAIKGITGSPWIGLNHFRQFFSSYYFVDLIRNTLLISLYQLVAGFPLPIILALSINEMKNGPFKKTIQMVTNAPHFISSVVICGMLISFLSPSSGIINKLITTLGGEAIYFINEPKWFKTVYVISDIWQNTGWNSIIYIAVLAGVSPDLLEAAKIDGASRLQRIWYVNIPSILPTVITMLILNCGKIMTVGFEKIYLLQNDLNIQASDVISTYVYRAGLVNSRFSYASAIELFNSVINVILLLTVNRISRKVSDQSLW